MRGDPSRHVIDLLVRLGDEYRHLEGDHGRETGPRARRRLREKMARLGERFERVLSRWVQDEALRRAWDDFLHRGGDAPDEPRLAPPRVFMGIDEVGSVVEIRPREDRGYDVIVDGTVMRHEAVPWRLDPDLIEPIQIGEHACREVFEAPPEAVNELQRFLSTPGAEPPWRWARALVEDGLVDVDFALTPRGQRRLARPAPRAAEAGAGITIGVIVADAARARVLVLAELGSAPARLVEVAAVTHPERRARDSEVLSETRPGLRREGPHGPRHGMDDHRDRHRRAVDREFARLAVDEAVRNWRAHGATRVIVAASPAMLGLLRPAIARSNGGQKPFGVLELARDLTRLSPPALHDALAEAGLLPPRGRPSVPSPPIGAPAS
jgi:hypothetical protein